MIRFISTINSFDIFIKLPSPEWCRRPQYWNSSRLPLTAPLLCSILFSPLLEHARCKRPARPENTTACWCHSFTEQFIIPSSFKSEKKSSCLRNIIASTLSSKGLVAASYLLFAQELFLQRLQRLFWQQLSQRFNINLRGQLWFLKDSDKNRSSTFYSENKAFT